VKKAPKWMQGVLWSVNVEKLDVDRNKSYVITQSLNHGNVKILEWIFKNFSKDEIVSEIINPMRGVWYPRVLNYWQKKLEVKIPEEKSYFYGELSLDGSLRHSRGVFLLALLALSLLRQLKIILKRKRILEKQIKKTQKK